LDAARSSFSIREALSSIKSDHNHGAGRISRRALTILRLAALKDTTESPVELVRHLRLSAFAIASTHPSMLPLSNQLAHSLYIIQRKSPSRETIEGVRASVRLTTLRLARSQRRASLSIAHQASRLITDGDCIGTASFSETFIRLCEAARGQGKSFRVLAAESSVQQHRYGALTTSRLQRSGIETIQVPDRSLSREMRSARRFIVGADAILPDGSIINGQPSLTLSMLAFKYGMPFYVVCDSTKVSPNNQVKIEAGFELVPAGLVTALITEEGPLTRQELARLVSRVARWHKSCKQRS
jgi:translation initiation factor 2B subunit (eIF-2B alpha/beta/delta family)